jgi:hypothetical protein
MLKGLTPARGCRATCGIRREVVSARWSIDDGIGNQAELPRKNSAEDGEAKQIGASTAGGVASVVPRCNPEVSMRRCEPTLSSAGFDRRQGLYEVLGRSQRP